MRVFPKKSSMVAAVVAVIAGAAVLYAGITPSFAADRHVIKIKPDSRSERAWSADAWLYDGSGNFIHQWHEYHNDDGDGLVHWEFTDGGDGGWIDIVIHPDEGVDFHWARDCIGKLNCTTGKLSLKEDHCFEFDQSNYAKEKDDVYERKPCDF